MVGVTDALFDHELAQMVIRPDAADGLDHALDIIGIDIDGVRAARFFQAGTCAGDDRYRTVECFEDGDAETLDARGLDKEIGQTIDGRQIIERYLVEELHLCFQTLGMDIALHL